MGNAIAIEVAAPKDAIHDLVKRACDLEIHSPKSDEFKAAHLAVRNYVAEHPDSVAKVGSFDVTVLHTACGYAAPKTLELLLASDQVDLLALNEFDQTPLCRLYKYARRQQGSKECAELLDKALKDRGLSDDSAPRDSSEYGLKETGDDAQTEACKRKQEDDDCGAKRSKVA